MDDENGEFSWSGRLRKIRVRDGEIVTRLLEERQGVDSRDKVRHNEKTYQLFVKMTKLDKKEWPQMRDGWGWTVMRWCRYEGLLVVRTLCVMNRILYSMHSIILSQWRECKMGVMWQENSGSVAGMLFETWVDRSKESFGVDNGGGDAIGCFEVEVRTDATKLTNIIAGFRKRWDLIGFSVVCGLYEFLAISNSAL